MSSGPSTVSSIGDLQCPPGARPGVARAESVWVSKWVSGRRSRAIHAYEGEPPRGKTWASFSPREACDGRALLSQETALGS